MNARQPETGDGGHTSREVLVRLLMGWAVVGSAVAAGFIAVALHVLAA